MKKKTAENKKQLKVVGFFWGFSQNISLQMTHLASILTSFWSDIFGQRYFQSSLHMNVVECGVKNPSQHTPSFLFGAVCQREQRQPMFFSWYPPPTHTPHTPHTHTLQQQPPPPPPTVDAKIWKLAFQLSFLQERLQTPAATTNHHHGGTSSWKLRL